ncbi:translation initiation factor eIF2 assembly protein [Leptinotarsa decemlineata]|uniref:translation initiation factor eIF2 assembly protein n=1 Tax=Leptinotarsa decemlineata TaxID=7539 RepID=UPI003D308F89
MLELQDYQDFSIKNWYETFKHVSLKTIIVDLPDQLLKKIQCNEISDHSEDETENSEGEADIEKDLSGFLEQFNNALNTLNKAVFVKNNWHAPLDARMFSFGNILKALDLDDVMLYFTNSIVIQKDFANAKNAPFCIALRQWISIHPASEFRCIVVNNILRGITPRDWPAYYAHFKDDGPQIIEGLSNFYNVNIKLKFFRKSFIFDVVFQYPDAPIIVDFGPLNSKTNLYAFTWKEIQPLISKEVPEDVAPVFRYLESDIGIIEKDK